MKNPTSDLVGFFALDGRNEYRRFRGCLNALGKERQWRSLRAANPTAIGCSS
jgi:hypothetical protein